MPLACAWLWPVVTFWLGLLACLVVLYAMSAVFDRRAEE